MVSTAVTDPPQYLLNGTLDLCALQYADNGQAFTGKLFYLFDFRLLGK